MADLSRHGAACFVGLMAVTVSKGGLFVNARSGDDSRQFFELDDSKADDDTPTHSPTTNSKG
jgi:hypothetical protein